MITALCRGTLFKFSPEALFLIHQQEKKFLNCYYSLFLHHIFILYQNFDLSRCFLIRIKGQAWVYMVYTKTVLYIGKIRGHYKLEKYAYYPLILSLYSLGAFHPWVNMCITVLVHYHHIRLNIARNNFKEIFTTRDSLLDSQLDSPLHPPLDSPLDSQLHPLLDSPLDSPLDSSLDSPFDSLFDSPVDSPLKGQSHEIFCTLFFPPNSSSWSH